MGKAREYCCCAIPLVNAGIYVALVEQFVAGLSAGIISVATPRIVGAATFDAAKLVFGIVCWVGAAIQVLGFLAVSREKPDLFRRYAQLNNLATLGAFSVVSAWIIISATSHSKANTRCQKDFFPTPDGNTSSLGETLCNIFPWVDVGIMGGLWVILAIMQFYLLVVVKSYSNGQSTAHREFDDPANPLNRPNSMAMHARTHSADAWDSRPSMDVQTKALEQGAYGQVNEDPFGGEKYAPRAPEGAYTQDPGPTPHFNNSERFENTSGMVMPDRTQAHPAEGSFGRKMPRQRDTVDQYADPYYRQ